MLYANDGRRNDKVMAVARLGSGLPPLPPLPNPDDDDDDPDAPEPLGEPPMPIPVPPPAEPPPLHVRAARGPRNEARTTQAWGFR